MDTTGKLLILGLGNTLLRDDAVGIVVAKELYRRIKSQDIHYTESTYAGWRLIDLLEGYPRVIIIDSIVGTGCKPGECCKIDMPYGSPLHLGGTSHGLGLNDALGLARNAGYTMPEQFSVYGIEVENPYEFGETMSPSIVKEIPSIVDQILKEEQLEISLSTDSNRGGEAYGTHNA